MARSAAGFVHTSLHMPSALKKQSATVVVSLTELILWNKLFDDFTVQARMNNSLLIEHVGHEIRILCIVMVGVSRDISVKVSRYQKMMWGFIFISSRLAILLHYQ